MTSAKELLDALEACGCRAQMDGEKVKVLGDSKAVSSELIDRMRIHRDIVVHELMRRDRVALCDYLIRKLYLVATGKYDAASEMIGSLTMWRTQLGYGLQPGEAYLAPRRERFGAKLRALLPDVFVVPDLEGQELLRAACSAFPNAQTGQVRSAPEAQPSASEAAMAVASS